ncbi:MAG TPA: beta-N-acetylhexosaminidase [Longimicrobiaceae bacterium]|nr:beta-N-acetylhexosaminidase [Longimicrobiaceae bacterium]
MKTTHHAAILCCSLVTAACAPSAPSTGPAPATSTAVHAASDYDLIPYPQKLTPGAGWFRLERQTSVVLPASADARTRGAVERWAADVRAASGLQLPVEVGGRARAGAIQLRLDPAASTNPEGYRLSVTPRRVTLSAPAGAGLFYGLQTLRQLLPPEVEADVPASLSASAWRLPAVEIEDAPRFAYRGLHLDVGRHFFPVQFIERYIDLMARYKYNTFQWHLTEDQGWRLQIEKYPRLTEVGGCRAETQVAKHRDPYLGDEQRYCGFYTQDEAREIVQYAKDRFITVIPEIEMPGHSSAALAAYPELGCGSGPYKVATTWGVFEDIYCPKEETFSFLEDVLTEVMQIFPSQYIHIGGDEAPKTAWEQSPIAQAVIQREGLKDERELQSYFIQRIEKFLNAHGRRIIGWDEILEGGLAPNATVMSWRGIQGGIAAARQGHDVIMTPTDFLYLDYYQGDPKTEPLAIGGFVPMEKVYSYEPVPDSLTAEQAKHILGAQANVWTEYMQTPERVEYMVYPRAIALSEVVWSPRAERDWGSFTRRLPAQLKHLDELGVNYRKPVEILAGSH